MAESVGDIKTLSQVTHLVFITAKTLRQLIDLVFATADYMD